MAVELSSKTNARLGTELKQILMKYNLYTLPRTTSLIFNHTFAHLSATV